MKIKSINIINGKNKWSESKDKLIHMVLDLGEFEEKPSNKIEGFYERIKEYLPSLKSHRCSEGKPGGFFKRIKDGTWMGHIIEHVALELQTLAGMDTGWGRTRGVKGQKGVYNVVFNYEDKDKGKLAAREAFNVVTDIINDRDPKIDNVVKKLKPKNLQESIRRILREENYSPAGKEITPNKIVIHKSNPKVRNKILNEGLKARAGECYKIYAGYGEKCIPAIFATNSTNKRAWFDSTYDDDIWAINTEMIPDVKWYKDRHFESSKKHIVTFENIPSEAIELMREGTGRDMIRESNDNKFNKEKITKTFQDIINKTLNEIKNICGDEDDDTFPDWLSDDDCSVADSIDKITILNIEKRTNTMNRTPIFKVDVNLTFNSIFAWIDYDDLMYRIANRIIGKWRIHLIFNIKEQENSNKREMWESGKHKNINESKFFRRRIDLDGVKELLSVNAQQVFYETESYEQFKYEVTLRAVESIMWNEYKMGYEDLPEQEEIEFVTEVSDMFNDIIIDLYKRIRGNM